LSYYRTCPDCGAHLDSGERCDCQEHDKTGHFDNKGENNHEKD